MDEGSYSPATGRILTVFRSQLYEGIPIVRLGRIIQDHPVGPFKSAIDAALKHLPSGRTRSNQPGGLHEPLAERATITRNHVHMPRPETSRTVIAVAALLQGQNLCSAMPAQEGVIS